MVAIASSIFALGLVCGGGSVWMTLRPEKGLDLYSSYTNYYAGDVTSFTSGSAAACEAAVCGIDAWTYGTWGKCFAKKFTGVESYEKDTTSGQCIQSRRRRSR